MKVLGIDEAGRGCVLGDLVIAGYAVDDPDEGSLRAAGAADSKSVPIARRRAACTQLASLGAVEIRRVDARAIDAGNLNALEEQAILSMICAVRPDRVELDALGHPNTLSRLEARLLASLPPDVQPRFTIEPKADATYAAVGAASIFAKTTRDEVLDGWRDEYGDFGSGYPSDPKTRAWLVEWARSGRAWPTFVRSRWATIEILAQQALFADPPPPPSPASRAARSR